MGQPLELRPDGLAGYVRGYLSKNYNRDILQELVLAACPTIAWPGTSEKIQVMRERIERGELPCHPDDPQLYLDDWPERYWPNPARGSR